MRRSIPVARARRPMTRRSIWPALFVAVGAVVKSVGARADEAAPVAPQTFTLGQAMLRRRSLSKRPRGARAGRGVGCRRLDREVGIPAATRYHLAVEPRHGQQRLRSIAAAVGDSLDVRSGPDLGVRRQRLGERHRHAVFVAAVRFRCSRRDRGRRGGRRGPLAGQRGADASRRSDRRRHGLSHHRRGTARRAGDAGRPGRPFCSPMSCTPWWRISCGRARKHRGATRNRPLPERGLSKPGRPSHSRRSPWRGFWA